MEQKKPSLEEKTLKSQVLARGNFLEIRRDMVQLPDGTQASREYCVHPGAVVIMAVLADGRILMERQYRYSVRQEVLEFPAGKRDAGEPALQTAIRELHEETGYRATKWAYAGPIYPCVGYSDEVLEAWLATGLKAGERQLDEGEFLDVFPVTLDEVNAWALAGKIPDSKTLACLHWLNAWKNGLWEPRWQNG